MMKVGRLGRVKPRPEEERVDPKPPVAMAVPSGTTDQADPPVPKSGVFITPRLSPDIVDPKLRDFLDLLALVA